MTDSEKPVLLATVFTDYICPFCYVGDVRLDRLREHFDLKINWCFVEIHPETPVEGMPVSSLGYDDARWQLMMDNLSTMAQEEGIDFQWLLAVRFECEQGSRQRKQEHSRR